MHAVLTGTEEGARAGVLAHLQGRLVPGGASVNAEGESKDLCLPEL